MIIDPFATPVDETRREQVVHGSSAFPIACYFNDLLRMPVLLHWHEELEAGIVTQGCAVLSIGNEKHLLRTGEGFFINSGVLHDAYALEDSPCVIHSMVFHPRLVGGSPDSVYYRKYLRPLLDSPQLEWILFPSHDLSLEAIHRAWNACRDEAAGYEFSVRNALSTLMWQICSRQPETGRIIRSKSLRDSTRIKLMLSYIHENFSQNISTHAIASSAAISESECLRCFRCVLDTTPISYLRQHRLRQAAIRLSSTNDKVSEIAAACGFQDMSYFSKAFRESEGCTPLEYRRNRSDQKSLRL